ncbi:MAG: type II secretion system secretin GspD [Gammaproteobacteria bacterium]|nr:type II secretion system secretin GspD [Gammaproteobacteria bacterium]
MQKNKAVYNDPGIIRPTGGMARLFIALMLCVALPCLAANTIRINLKDAEIRELITQVSAITGKTFVVDPRVKGKVTIISSSNMDADAVYNLFLNVLRVHGFAAVPAGDVVKVVQQVLAKQSPNDYDFNDTLENEEIITRVLPVRNSSAEELVKIIRPIVPQYGHLAALNDPNVLIVSDHANNIARIEDMVRRIDVADTSRTETIALEEAWVTDMVALLEQLAPEEIGKGAKGPRKVNIVANERTNTLVVKGDPYTLDKVRNLVMRLDVKSNRSGGIQVIQLAHADAEETAQLLENLVSQQGNPSSGGGPDSISIQPDPALNALVVRADPASMLEIRNIVKKLDVRRLQVLIEAAVVEVAEGFSRRLGTEIAVADQNAASLPLMITEPQGTLASILPLTNILEALSSGGTPVISGDDALIGAGRVSDTGTSWGLIIRALASNNDVNLLSTPSITTLNNKEAKIVVGQNVPFRTGSTISGSDGASNPFTTIQREDVGLTLQVTPHVHDGNLVRLEIHQEVSEVNQSSLGAIGSEGSADIITDKRTIETTVLADDKEVIILGGLIRDKTDLTEKRVPILGSIPVLGRLFRSTSRVENKQNLLVFMRPTVLTDREDIRRETKRKYDGIWEVEISGKDSSEAISELFNGRKP